MYLKFVPKSHLFFTAGKDRKIKQWDADKFEHVQTLEVTSRLLCFPLSTEELKTECWPPADVSR